MIIIIIIIIPCTCSYRNISLLILFNSNNKTCLSHAHFGWFKDHWMDDYWVLGESSYRVYLRHTKKKTKQLSSQPISQDKKNGKSVLIYSFRGGGVEFWAGRIVMGWGNIYNLSTYIDKKLLGFCFCSL